MFCWTYLHFSQKVYKLCKAKFFSDRIRGDKNQILRTLDSDLALRVKLEEAIVYIENISKERVLSVNGDEVELVSLTKNNPNQMWNKGFVDANGYFTLSSLLSIAVNSKALTAISANSLGIRGR